MLSLSLKSPDGEQLIVRHITQVRKGRVQQGLSEASFSLCLPVLSVSRGPQNKNESAPPIELSAGITA